MRGTRLFVISLSVLTVLPGCSRTGSGGRAGVVGGTAEPDFLYPWVVRTSGTRSCHGVLIHPRWVLTAAHCVVTGATGVSFTRTDPFTGEVSEDSRLPAGSGLQGVFVHPDFNHPNALDNDIALIKLAKPFEINPPIQTVGLPSGPRVAGRVGTVASFSHTQMLPPGKLAIFRAPIPQQDAVRIFHIATTDETGSLCPGDSGSGFVTFENGRAIVRGIASAVISGSDCVTPSGNEVDFTDVFAFRKWILDTIRMTDVFLAGNTRLHREGRAAHGVMGIGCVNPYGTMWGPLNVPGVEEGANCEGDQTQSVVCSLSPHQAGSAVIQVQITGFTMKTMHGDGSTEVKSLPFSPTWASFYGPLPFGDFREFTCRIGLGVAADPGEGGVLAQ
ncbi:MAG TPA: trypsin-like serine protease [Longimicrobiaceae bacterium]